MNALFAHRTPLAPPSPSPFAPPAPRPSMFQKRAPAGGERENRLFSPSLSQAPAAFPPPQAATTAPGAALSKLGERERALINSIAAQQFRYGQIDEALALLQLSLRYAPEDVSTLRLLAQVLAAAGDWETVDQILDAVDRLGAPKDRRSFFLRMLSALRRQGVAAAQNLFHAYRSFGA